MIRRFVSPVWICVELTVLLCTFAGCHKQDAVDENEKAAAAKLKAAKDPVLDEIYRFRLEVRQKYNARRFDELEELAEELRRTEPRFDNGSWKIKQFYESFTCRPDEPEDMWQLHDQIHRDWIQRFPSMTARVAQADFFVAYAWHARGHGYSNTVSAKNAETFRDRIDIAREVLESARQLPDRDPVWWSALLRVGVAQGRTKAEFDRIVSEATSIEPQFWGYDISRAESLLPRWYGEPGEWEVYAEQAATRPGGLGEESYARIVIALKGYYKNIFTETKASWSKTQTGLEQMRRRYPRSLEVINQYASLAMLADDRKAARVALSELGDSYLPSIWEKPEWFLRFKMWAEQGR